MTVDQRIAHRKVLGQTDQAVVDRRVSVGMIAAQHVADGGGRLAIGLVGGQIVLVHGVEDAPVDRLEAVPHIGQGAGDDDAHGIVDEGILHLLVQVHDLYLLVLESQIVHKTLFISPSDRRFWEKPDIRPRPGSSGSA